MAGFHHNVCGQLHNFWFRLFLQLQKPLKGLWMNISCSHVHYCREGGDAIHSLQIFFSSLWFSQTTKKTTHPVQSAGWRLMLVQYTVVLCDVPTAREVSDYSWKSTVAAEADLITERSFDSPEFERAGMNLIPGWRLLQSDVLILLNLKKTEHSLRSTELGLTQKRRVLSDSSLKQQIYTPSHHSCGSGAQEQLIWVILIWGLSWGCSQTIG